MDNKVTNLAADDIRILAASMVEKGQFGSPRWCDGGCRLRQRALLGVPGL